MATDCIEEVKKQIEDGKLKKTSIRSLKKHLENIDFILAEGGPDVRERVNEYINKNLKEREVNKSIRVQTAAAVEKRKKIIEESFGGNYWNGMAAMYGGVEHIAADQSALTIEALGRTHTAEIVNPVYVELKSMGLKDTFVKEKDSKSIYQAQWALGAGVEPSKDLPEHAVKIAKVLDGADKLMYDKKRATGSPVERLATRVVRLQHSATEIFGTAITKEQIQTKKEAFKSNVMQWLDLRKTFKSSADNPKKMDELLNDFLDAVYSDKSDVENSADSTDLDKQMAISRMFVFKDQESAAAYFDTYTNGNLHHQWRTGMQRDGIRVAGIKEMGPSMRDTHNALMALGDAAAKKDPVKGAEWFRYRSMLEHQFKNLEGVGSGNGRNWASFLSSMAVTVQTGGLLSNAVVNSVGPDIVGAFTMRSAKTGKTLFQAAQDHMNGLMALMNNDERLHFALSALDTVEMDSLQMAQALNSDSPVLGGANTITRKIMGWSGLPKITEMNMQSDMFSIFKDVARNKNNTLDGVNPRLKQMFLRFGIKEPQWDLIRLGSESSQFGESIHPDSVKNVPIEKVKEVVDRYKIDMSPEDFQDETMRRYAVTARREAAIALKMPELRERAIMNQGQSDATPIGAASKMVFFLRSFILKGEQYRKSIMMSDPNSSLEEYRNFSYKNWLDGDTTSFAASFVGQGVAGLAALSLLAVLQGKEPPDPTSPTTIRDAILRGGMAGIWLDQLGGAYARKSGWVEAIVGPAISNPVKAVGETGLAFMAPFGEGGFDDRARRSGKHLLEAMTNVSPIPRNPMILKPIYNYLVGYRINEILNPGWASRYERHMGADKDIAGGKREMLFEALRPTRSQYESGIYRMLKNKE